MGGSSDLHRPALIGIGVLVVVGAALAVPRVRRLAAAKVLPQLSQAKENLRELASRPAKLVQLFGSNAVSQILFALCLGLCLKGFGGSAPLSVLVLVNTAAALLGGIAPIPGGMGVVEAGLIAGLTAAGVPQQQAIAATFAYRLITAYLPPLWGWPAMVRCAAGTTSEPSEVRSSGVHELARNGDHVDECAVAPDRDLGTAADRVLDHELLQCRARRDRLT